MLVLYLYVSRSVLEIIVNLQKPVGDVEEPNPEETDGSDKCTEALSLFQEAPSALRAAFSKKPATAVGSARNLSDFKEFVPTKKPLVNNETSEFNAADGHNRDHKTDKPDGVVMVQNNSGKFLISAHPA